MARFFFGGRLSDLAGSDTAERALPEDVTDTAALRRWADGTFHGDGAFSARWVRIAINDEIVAEPHAVSDGDEIGFFPPVSGG